MTPFRRNFDAEAVARARGERPGMFVGGGSTTPAVELAENRTIVTACRPDLLDGIVKAARKSCGPIMKVDTVGDDWHITTPTRGQTDRVLAFLKLSGAHGVIRVRR